MKAEILQLQQDNENLQTKLHNLVIARQQDKQKLSQLEKKLQEEKKNRLSLECQLNVERKAKKAEENIATKVSAVAATSKADCTDSCKIEKQELENDLKQLKRDLKAKDEQVRQINKEAQSLRQYKDSYGDNEILMSALSAMQEKNMQIENRLSAETKLKLNLFSSFGETKRQLDISQGKSLYSSCNSSNLLNSLSFFISFFSFLLALLLQKEKEIDELKSKIAEVMAVMPSVSSFTDLNNELCSPIIYNSKFLTNPRNENSIDPSTSTVYSTTSLDIN